jgi:hypothetical protein
MKAMQWVMEGQASQKVQRRVARLRPCDFEMVVLVWR